MLLQVSAQLLLFLEDLLNFLFLQMFMIPEFY